MRYTRISRRGFLSALAAVCLLPLLSTGGTHAADCIWDTTTANWSAPGSWDPYEPDSTDDALINNGGTAQITGTSYEYADDLFLGEALGQSGHVTMTGGHLYVDHHQTIGYGGTGSFVQSAGENRCSYGLSNYDLYIGREATGVGAYTLSGGHLYAGDEYVGRYGVGLFLHSGGTNHVSGTGASLADDLVIGHAGAGGAGVGMYRLSGTGQLVMAHEDAKILVGQEYGGYVGEGRFEWFRGGGITIGGSGGSGRMEFDPDAAGTLAMGYDFNAQQLMSGALIPVWGLDSATVEVTNGATATKNTTGAAGLKDLRIGSATGAGTGDLSAGTLDIDRDEFIGDAGTGVMNHTGGTNDVGRDLYVGRSGGTGTYDLSGSGLVTVGQKEHVGYGGAGSLLQTGGTNTVAGTLYLGQFVTGDGTYHLSGTGQMSAASIHVGADADLGTGRFEWFRSGGISSSGMVLGAKGTLAMGYDFDVTQLAGGALIPISHLDEATLEVTHNASATHDTTSATVGDLVIGTSQGAGTYTLDNGATLNTTNTYVGYDGSGTFHHYAGTHDYTDLYVGYGPGSSGQYVEYAVTSNLMGGFVCAYIGYEGTGVFEHRNGSHQDGVVTLGYASGSEGTYTIEGGSLTTDDLTVAREGTGTFTLTGGGSVTVNPGGSVEVGAQGGFGRFEWYRGGGLSTPQMTLGARGTLAMGASFDVGDLASGALFGGTLNGLGVATLEVTGGATATQNAGDALTAGTLRIGSADGPGRYEWFDGTLSTPHVELGSNATWAMGFSFKMADLADGTLFGGLLTGLGQATLEVAGGATATHDHSTGPVRIRDLRVGTSAGSGNYVLENGATLDTYVSYVGYEGTGRFDHYAGDHNIETDLYVGYGPGSYGEYVCWAVTSNIMGGFAVKCATVGDRGTGVFTQHHGTTTINGTLAIGRQPGGQGTVTIHDGLLEAHVIDIGPAGEGTLNIAGPDAEILVKDALLLGPGSVLEAVPGSEIHLQAARFDNRSTDPVDLAGLGNLAMVFQGGVAPMATFELAGEDRGAVMSGFDENFALGSLDVGGAEEAYLLLGDLFDNSPGGGLEALYLDDLRVGPGSILDMNPFLDFHVYYRGTLTVEGEIINGYPEYVPEPGTLTLLAAGAALLGWRKRRSR